MYMPKKQKSGLYRSKIVIGHNKDGKPINRWISGKTKAELERERQKALSIYVEGTLAEKDRLFGEYAVEWYRLRKAPHIEKSTQQDYRYTLNKHILPAFGGRNLRAIQPADLQTFLNRFAGSSQTKVTMITASLRGIFRAACADRILMRDPTSHLTKPTINPPKEKRALSEDERQRLTSQCATHPQGAYLASMYYLGVRPGEARGLQWGDIDWTALRVHIQRDVDYKDGGKVGALKNASSDRHIPMPSVLADILRPLVGTPDAFLFAGERSHAALSKTTADRLWIELMLACGMVTPIEDGGSKLPARDIRAQYHPTITPHMLRHNYITLCWENGIDVYTTMRLAGHKSIKTTMDIYTHLSNAQLDAASTQVEDMFAETKVAQKLHEPSHSAPQNKKTPQNLNDSGACNGDPSETRTPDPLIKSQMLYRLS